MTIQNRLEEETIHLGPKQSEGVKIAKASFYLFLSAGKGIIQALLLIVWFIVGLVFAANALPSFVSVRDFVLNFQIPILFILFLYETIVNFKAIKRDGSSGR